MSDYLRPLIFLILAVVLGFIWNQWVPAQDDDLYYQDYITPHLVQMPDRQMLTIESALDPHVSLQRVNRELQALYDALPLSDRLIGKSVIRTRRMPKGGGYRYALPVSDKCTSIPAGNITAGTPKIQSFTYGRMLEAAHIGPYATLGQTRAALEAFASAKQYMLSDYEETYVKGPGVFFKGNPKAYITWVRYRVISPITHANLNSQQAGIISDSREETGLKRR